MKPLVERHRYLAGASPQRPIDPVHSMMEEAIRTNKMPDFDAPTETSAVKNDLITCAQCGRQTEPFYQFGQNWPLKVCGECFEAKRFASQIATQAKVTAYLKAERKKDKEAKKQAEQVVFEPDKPVEIVSEMDVQENVLLAKQKMGYCVKGSIDVPLTAEQEKYYEEVVEKPFPFPTKGPSELYKTLTEAILKQNQQILDMNAELLRTLTLPAFVVDTDKPPSE